MRAEGLSDAAVAAFRHNYEALASGESGLLAESDIALVESLPSLDDLKGVCLPLRVHIRCVCLAHDLVPCIVQAPPRLLTSRPCWPRPVC
jgi:hypothetical protein